MFSTIHSVYSIPPSQPGGVTSGHRPGPSFFVNSTSTPADEKSSTEILAVIGQFATSRGTLITFTPWRSIASCPPVLGGCGGSFVANASVRDHGPTVVGSEARTCQ